MILKRCWKGVFPVGAQTVRLSICPSYQTVTHRVGVARDSFLNLILWSFWHIRLSLKLIYGQELRRGHNEKVQLYYIRAIRRGFAAWLITKAIKATSGDFCTVRMETVYVQERRAVAMRQLTFLLRGLIDWRQRTGRKFNNATVCTIPPSHTSSLAGADILRPCLCCTVTITTSEHWTFWALSSPRVSTGQPFIPEWWCHLARNGEWSVTGCRTTANMWLKAQENRQVLKNSIFL